MTNEEIALYDQGWRDGAQELILQLRNKSKSSPKDCYKGEISLSLDRWLEKFEERLPSRILE